MAFDPATGGYTRLVSVVDPKINMRVDPDTRSPRTDEYSVGVDREIGRRLARGDRLHRTRPAATTSDGRMWAVSTGRIRERCPMAGACRCTCS